MEEELVITAYLNTFLTVGMALFNVLILSALLKISESDGHEIGDVKAGFNLKCREYQNSRLNKSVMGEIVRFCARKCPLAWRNICQLRPILARTFVPFVVNAAGRS